MAKDNLLRRRRIKAQILAQPKATDFAIAKALRVSHRTVKDERKNLIEKGLLPKPPEPPPAPKPIPLPYREIKKILICDDERECAEAIRLALDASGFETLMARDGNQCLATVERENPDLLIIEMTIPKRSGLLVLTKLRDTRPSPMRVIMVTANEGARHKVYAETLGVDDYIRKPFAMDKLLDSVTRLLR